jgi:alpha-glucosidase
VGLSAKWTLAWTWVAPLLLPLTATADTGLEVRSPNGQVVSTLQVRDCGPARGCLLYRVALRGRPVLVESRLGLEVEEGSLERDLSIVGQARTHRDARWRPPYGERTTIPDRYNSVTIDLAAAGPPARRMKVECRAYDEGVAFRYVLPAPPVGGWRIRQERSEFRFAPGSTAYPIHETEETFPTEAVPIDEVKPGALIPLTVRLRDGGVASVLEAHVLDYPRMTLGRTPDGALVTRLRGPVESGAAFASPWRVVLLGEAEGRLVENEHLVLSLNPPCAIADTSWIRPGKTISNEGSAPLETRVLERVVDFASENAFRYLQLDWGWYGTEWAWTDAERETFRRTMPQLAADPAWVVNTYADPFKVAKGPVPYRPDWKSVTDVDLDLPGLVRHGRDRNVGLCLYVEADHTLRDVDMDRLFATYREWGVVGLKPGFVRVGSQENTRWIRRMVETAARHRLWLCIHDGHLPDGMERTWPNVFISEGGGGQEGNHPASHDVTLPFTRNLAGAFDYTPGLYTQGKSHAHMLAMLVVYYGPTQTIRGGYPAWNGERGPGRGGVEIEFLRRVPVTWDDTRVLDARIARRVVVARRSGDTWFLGGMSGAEKERADLSLSFLEPGRTYAARIYRDDPSAAADGFCPAALETKFVTSRDRLTVAMERAGGFVATLDPAPGEGARP